MNKKIYCPSLPFSTDSNDQYLVITGVLENVKQKLKMLILTNPGEKIMDPAFGVGIKKYLFEPSSGKLGVSFKDGIKKISVRSYSASLETEIQVQVKKYMDDILIQDLSFSIEDNQLNLSINFVYGTYYSDTLFIIF